MDRHEQTITFAGERASRIFHFAEEFDMSLNYTRIIIAGIAGTIAMTVVAVFGAPMMGLAPMNPATMLAEAMGGMVALGWIGHFMIGILFAFGYVLASPYLPGPGAARGAIYAIAPWLLAQIAGMPMMGMPIFSGSVMVAMASLIAHVIYGLVVGAIIGASPSVPALRPARPAL